MNFFMRLAVAAATGAFLVGQTAAAVALSIAPTPQAETNVTQIRYGHAARPGGGAHFRPGGMHRPPVHARPPAQVRPPVHVRPPVGPGYHGGHWGAWHRPQYGWRPGGAIAAGAALGFLSAAAAAAYATSAAPGPGLCWYYTDASRRAGFWDACP